MTAHARETIAYQAYLEHYRACDDEEARVEIAQDLERARQAMWLAWLTETYENA